MATRAPAGPQQYADFGLQEYLGSAGINLPVASKNAKASWKRYTGRGVWFIPIEDGWNVHHEAFGDHVRDHDPGGGFPFVAAHGNAALGIVLADGPNSRIRGIAPDCDLRGLYRLSDEAGARTEQPATAIELATEKLRAGDVLLLEFQPESFLPPEVDPDVFGAIERAVAKGICVIEPAGNRGGSMEERIRNAPDAQAWTSGQSKTPNGKIPDSGAIVVGGCTVGQFNGKFDPPVQDTRTRIGARIDCFAWSDRVWTSYGSDPSEYADFGYTSAAAAIIAGLALLVQQCAKKNLQRPLTPSELRELFRDSACGTVVRSRDEQYPKRPMPDACKLFDKIESMRPR